MYRDATWNQDWPARQQFGGMNDFPIDFTLFIYCPEVDTDVDQMWSNLRYQLIRFIENPDDLDNRGMEWLDKDEQTVGEIVGPQVISFEKTNYYLVNGERKPVTHPFYAANLRVMAKVWNRADGDQ